MDTMPDPNKEAWDDETLALARRFGDPDGEADTAAARRTAGLLLGAAYEWVAVLSELAGQGRDLTPEERVTCASLSVSLLRWSDALLAGGPLPSLAYDPIRLFNETREVNQQRRQQGLPPLRPFARLEDAR